MTLMALAQRESFPYTWHIWVIVEADGVMIARKTISIILFPSAENIARWLILIITSASKGTAIRRRNDTKYKQKKNKEIKNRNYKIAQKFDYKEFNKNVDKNLKKAIDYCVQGMGYKEGHD